MWWSRRERRRRRGGRVARRRAPARGPSARRGRAARGGPMSDSDEATRDALGRYRETVTRILDALLETDPVWASQLGDHRFDAALPDLSSGAVQARHDHARRGPRRPGRPGRRRPGQRRPGRPGAAALQGERRPVVADRAAPARVGPAGAPARRRDLLPGLPRHRPRRSSGPVRWPPGCAGVPRAARRSPARSWARCRGSTSRPRGCSSAAASSLLDERCRGAAAAGADRA